MRADVSERQVQWTDRSGALLEPSHFALDASRGMSPPELVTYMRWSVLVLEAAVWWSAVVAWIRLERKRTGRSSRSEVSADRM